jgi:hypothetical protein
MVETIITVVVVLFNATVGTSKSYWRIFIITLEKNVCDVILILGKIFRQFQTKVFNLFQTDPLQ